MASRQRAALVAAVDAARHRRESPEEEVIG
jgi:hypothetical protein